MIPVRVVIAVVILLVIQGVMIVSQVMALALDIPVPYATLLAMTTTLPQAR